jgi:ATP-dependent helicase HrpB
VAALARHQNLIVTAPPGTGKTTEVPLALMQAGLAGAGRSVVVLEPRRLAARLAASRVAAGLREEPGQTVGWQVRFDVKASASTRLLFMTEGTLLRRLLAAPDLSDVGVVVLDEFHERHLQTDLALTLLRALQRSKRPDLRLVIMSATLAVEPLLAFLDDCGHVASSAALHAVDIEFLAQPDARPLEQQVAGAARSLGVENGSVLVFLPGAAEIRRAREACATVAELLGAELLTLHGDMPLAEQDAATRGGTRPRIILSTNVAESSITVEGVRAVIDSGLARVASHSPWSGLPRLKVQKISRASATQRAGRAGRLGPGRCVRLYTRLDYESRPEYDVPEIARADLAETWLSLAGLGLGEIEWLERPPEAHVAAAVELLQRLGALVDGDITEVGRRMLAFPLHPRLARFMVAAVDAGAGQRGAQVAALLSERDVLDRTHLNVVSDSDVLLRLEWFSDWQAHGFDARAVAAVRQSTLQLTKLLAGSWGHDRRDTVNELERCLLLAYPDRVAQWKRKKGKATIELLLSQGGSARLSEASSVREAEYGVAIDVEERDSGTPLVRLASRIEAEWLLDLEGDHVYLAGDYTWNPDTERVEDSQRMMYDRLVLDEKTMPARPSPQASTLLAAAAAKVGARAFVEPEALEHEMARLNFAATRLQPPLGRPLDESDVTAALAAMCDGRTSFKELRDAAAGGELFARLAKSVSPADRGKLDRMAPRFVSLGKRPRVKVHYAAGRDPWIESRLQDFFGMRAGPTVGGGSVPLVLHLLAPNHRPVQVTTDLAGFWERHYPRVRQELMRRYPRHAWPENPLT